jgi:hypothetical protein
VISNESITRRLRAHAKGIHVPNVFEIAAERIDQQADELKRLRKWIDSLRVVGQGTKQHRDDGSLTSKTFAFVGTEKP